MWGGWVEKERWEELLIFIRPGPHQRPLLGLPMWQLSQVVLWHCFHRQVAKVYLQSKYPCQLTSLFPLHRAEKKERLQPWDMNKSGGAGGEGSVGGEYKTKKNKIKKAIPSQNRAAGVCWRKRCQQVDVIKVLCSAPPSENVQRRQGLTQCQIGTRPLGTLSLAFVPL